MLRRLCDIDIALSLTHCLSSYTLGRVTRYLALLDRSVGGVCVGFGPHRHCLHIIFGAHRGGLSFKIPSPTSSQSSLSSLNFPRNTAARNLRQEFRTAFTEAKVNLTDLEIFTEADIIPVTLGYHICLTISSNCLVQRFLLIVAILYWGPWVILNAPGMVYGCDPGPGMIWTMVHGRGLFEWCLGSISNDPGLFLGCFWGIQN